MKPKGYGVGLINRQCVTLNQEIRRANGLKNLRAHQKLNLGKTLAQRDAETEEMRLYIANNPRRTY